MTTLFNLSIYKTTFLRENKTELPQSQTKSTLAFVVSHAAIPPEVYWKIKLPNTEMPKVIKDVLPHTDLNTNSNQKVYRGNFDYGVWPWHHAGTEEEISELKNDDNHFLYKPYFFENDLKKGNIINFPF
ncbi:hypothetical protein MTR67_008051 [Solanum verrucosum]|uniref:Uncharacterized protein n=1 Tax=Solanum verrucosum TaxID=315347 RepID=A0AAF0Q686_SOLVR|nr:hypothetical protein MTR67_008051 [Solanum verrucosum]